MYRVYLLPEWREFGIDYPDRATAERAAARFCASFPHRRYAVRRVGESAMSTRIPVALSDVADALSDMIDLADAWATCGPEGYTRDERRRRNRADRVLGRLYRRIEAERRAAS